jgi:deoxyribodipyrimidine photo-lyase
MEPLPAAGEEHPQPLPLRWPAQADDLPRPAGGREALLEVLAERLASTNDTVNRSVAPLRGGRRAALERLQAINPGAYGPSRNHLNGAITRLSADLRHGVLSLAEVRDAVAEQVLSPGGGGRPAGETLIRQLGWRDHWQRLWRQLGDGIWDDREPLKTGHPLTAYQATLPEDISESRTDLACIDAFSQELQQTGWLHNHARLWLASYVVHGRRVRWQAGARWFLSHLLDGDAASNALSWQWVASSFSHKPYLFNRANLSFHGAGHHCDGCRASADCPFAGSDEEVKGRWLRLEDGPTPEPRPAAALGAEPDGADEGAAATSLQRPIVWVHDGALSPENPALKAWPGAPAVFVFDRLQPRSASEAGGEPPWSLKRLLFVYECLLELPVTIRPGDGAEAVLAFARRCGADGVVTSGSIDPHVLRIQAQIRSELPLQVLEVEPFVRLSPEQEGNQPSRFSGHWRRTVEEVWRQARRSQPTPLPPA